MSKLTVFHKLFNYNLQLPSPPSPLVCEQFKASLHVLVTSVSSVPSAALVHGGQPGILLKNEQYHFVEEAASL